MPRVNRRRLTSTVTHQGFTPFSWFIHANFTSSSKTHTMNSSFRSALLICVDVTLGFLVICVLPFAWILKNGLGPDMVPATGLTALWRFFMTFYVGPAILLFGSFDLFLRKTGDAGKATSLGSSIITWIAALAAISALSLIFAAIVFRS